MKLKLVVASMSVLGLISCPAFAADAPKHKKHHHHHKMMHHMVTTHDYKDMGALPVQPMNDWYNRITLDGVMNFDTTWGNRSVGYMGENNRRFSLNNAQINLNANVNDWTKAFIAIAFDDTSNVISGASTAPNPLSITRRPKPGVYENIKGSTFGANFEQAYFTIGNMDEAPVYVKLGKQFVAFGKYDPHQITRSVTNVLSESLREAVSLGFETRMGLSGEVFAFDSPLRQSTNSHSKTNYGGQIAFAMPSDALGFDVGAGYMYDFTGVNDVAYAVTAYNGLTTYTTRVSALNLYGDVNSGPFSLALRYVTALQHFSAADMPTKGVLPAGTTGASPWGVDVSGMYNFNAFWDKKQDVYLGYQGTQNAVNLFLPKNRITAGYGVEMWKNTTVGLEFNHDTDYAVADGGTGNSSNQLHLRVGVKFS